MHDIWNPWHGCVKCSEGCAHCYMYFLDSQRGHNGAEIYRTLRPVRRRAKIRKILWPPVRKMRQPHDLQRLRKVR